MAATGAVAELILAPWAVKQQIEQHVLDTNAWKQLS